MLYPFDFITPSAHARADAITQRAEARSAGAGAIIIPRVYLYVLALPRSWARCAPAARETVCVVSVEGRVRTVSVSGWVFVLCWCSGTNGVFFLYVRVA